MEDLVTDCVFKASVLVPSSQGMRCIISLEEKESGRDVAQQILGRLQQECEAFGVGDLLLVAGLPEGVSPSNSGGEGAEAAAMGESPTGGGEGEKGEIPLDAEEEGESPVIEAERGGGGGGESPVDQGDSPVRDVESPVVLVVEEGKPLEDAGGSPVERDANERPEEEAPSNEGEAPGNEAETPGNEGEAPGNEGKFPIKAEEEEEDPEGESPVATETPVKEERTPTEAEATTEHDTSGANVTAATSTSSESEDKDEIATEATERGTTQASATTQDVTSESKDIAIEGLERGSTQANATTDRVTSGSEDKDDIATEATERGTTHSETTTAVQTEHKMVSITSAVEGTMHSPRPQLLTSVAATHSKPELPVRELAIGTSHDAIITSISTPHSFVCQLTSDTTAIESVQSLLSSLSLPLLETPPREGDIVCAVFSTDQALYRRAKVLSVEEGGKRFEILFVDFGNTEVVSLADLRGMRGEEGGVDLCGFPALAWECFLTGVELPSDSAVFDDSAAAKMLDLIGEDPVTVEIVTVDSAGHLGVKLTTSKGVNVAESLIEENLASPLVNSFLTTPSTNDATHSRH